MALYVRLERGGEYAQSLAGLGQVGRETTSDSCYAVDGFPARIGQLSAQIVLLRRLRAWRSAAHEHDLRMRGGCRDQRRGD